MDHDPIAGLHAAALQQSVIGGVIGAAEHRRRFEAHAGGDRVAILGARIAELREGAKPVPAHDLVAGFELRDPVADRDDFAGGLVAGDEGRVRPKLVFAGQHQHIDVLHAARADADLHLARAGRRRVGHLAQRQHLGPAKRFAHHRFHRLRLYRQSSSTKSPGRL